MSIRIVLYAEGGNELAGEVGAPAPGNAMGDLHLGAAHVLVRRVVGQGSSIPEDAITFLSGLRTRGRLPRGSDLLDGKVVRRLLTFPVRARRPDLGVVVIDEDDDKTRGPRLQEEIESLSLTVVVGVARLEFESWLLGDAAAVQSVLPGTAAPPNPEGLGRGEAKAWLAEAIANDPQECSHLDLRRSLASAADLSVLMRLRSFESFYKDLARAADGA